MRIGVDGYNLAMPHATGVATYGVELVRAIQAMGHQAEGVFGIRVPADPALREVALFDAVKRQADVARRPGRARTILRSMRPVRMRAVPLSDNVDKNAFTGSMPAFDRISSANHLFENALTFFRTTRRFVRITLPHAPAVMHWTYPVPIVVRGIPNIYTLHDLVPLKLPYTTRDNKALYGRLVAQCIACAAQLCTVSESSKRDIVDRFGIDPARVTNTYQTVEVLPAALQADPAEDARAIEGVFGLGHRDYFLYYGAIEPKKNVGRLIEAYLSARMTAPLVIVGARAWQSEGELRLIPEGGASGAAGIYHGHRGQTIVRLDYMPRELLAKLVRGAKALVFPSLYEGFGLPVLEAMALGTPVITSTASSLPEVAGDAGLLVNPFDVAALQAAMTRLDGDPELCAQMSIRGIEQARRFAPERYKERLAGLYRAAGVAV